MYLSKITLPTASLTPQRLIEMMARGEYVMHQWLWELFPGEAQRSYLYRRETLQKEFCFYVLSATAPQTEHALFGVQVRPFAPGVEEGETLRFTLRANPVITRNGKRHDVLMNAKREWRSANSDISLWECQQQAAIAWLAAQGEQSGFRLGQATVAAYQQQQIVKSRGEVIQFSCVDFAGVLQVTQPTLFLTRLAQGFGKCRAFGCGLMLIKPERRE